MQPKVAKILTRVGGATAIIIDRLFVSKTKGHKIMNIEIANKLVKLRKQAGLSQEELADKLGLSRQAVSKWERAEASPDTDNLICLAKLYGVSLDDLLSTEDDPETIIREQVKKDEDEPPKKDEKEGIHVGNDGVNIVGEDGERITINNNGINIIDENGKRVKINKGYDNRSSEEKRRDQAIYWAISGIFYTLAIVAYVLLGILLGWWGTMWIVFFVPDIIMSLYKAIRRKRAHHFNMVFLSTFSFFLVCLVLFPQANLWHPMWVVFLAIPIYYILVNRIEKIVYINVSDTDDDDDDNDNEKGEDSNDGEDDE